MSIGHPELIAAIAAEIAASGPISFARFMELALYHPQFGYYMRAPEQMAERIGWRGDFYTSSDVHPMLGQALAKQAEQIDRLLGHPDPFIVVEMGPGKGLLARHFLSACQRHFGSLFERLHYVLIERSPAMQVLQRENVARWLDQPNRLTWANDLANMALEGVNGLFLSNELIDSFPVHRIQVTANGIEELCVDYQRGRFVDCLRPLSSEALFDRVRQINTAWPEGYRTEINVHAVRWMRQVAQLIKRGVVLTIDYGHTAQDLYRPDRKGGTFLCYSRQSVNEEPFLRVGDQEHDRACGFHESGSYRGRIWSPHDRLHQSTEFSDGTRRRTHDRRAGTRQPDVQRRYSLAQATRYGNDVQGPCPAQGNRESRTGWLEVQAIL
ncbi:MAG: hypothetical protein HC938_00185 [Nitrospira sp.]|nr:hypothetical protein [Nitrospira sp.]